MIVATLPSKDGPHEVLLFGTGLIGSAVLAALAPGARVLRTVPYDWTDDTARRRAHPEIVASLSQEARAVSVVWTGGRSGFGSGPEDMARETSLVEEVLDLADATRGRAPASRHAIHLMSSAGGLFEGQTFCDARSTPAPRRPYGEGKLNQECLARARGGEARIHVFRPSSVYGVSPSGRVGLITALIGNALRGATTKIMGRPSTLRDYVHAGDVGRFVARKVMNTGAGADGATGCGTYLLAQGRPAAMSEVIARVEHVLNLRLGLQFDPDPGNARNMSFRSSALPDGWRQIDLATGIALVAQRLRQDHARHA